MDIALHFAAMRSSPAKPFSFAENQAYIIGGQDVEKPDHPLSSVIKAPVPTEKFVWGPLKDVPLPISAYAAVVLPPIEEPQSEHA